MELFPAVINAKELTAELSLSGPPSSDLRTKILSLILVSPLSLLWLKLLIGRAEVVYAGEGGSRGLLTRKQRGIFFLGGVPRAAAAPLITRSPRGRLKILNFTSGGVPGKGTSFVRPSPPP